MKERPILMSAPMVRSSLNGTKTQTRRVIKPQPYIDAMGNFVWNGWNYGQNSSGVPLIQKIASPLPQSTTGRVLCPYGVVGDQLWVRENGWERPQRTPKMMREGADTWQPYYYDADGYGCADSEDFKRWGFKRRPSIHMPRWASRLSLKITGVRVERLHGISETDAKAEGIVTPAYPPGMGAAKYACAFTQLWIEINGVASWNADPWVWVIEFKRVRG